MKIIVGLGNPGSQYQNTRHNFGFLVLNYWAGAETVWKNNSRLHCLEASLFKNGEKIWLIQPQTFMNDSGLSVEKFLQAHQTELDELLIVHDDLDLPWGKLRFKNGGSDGGHNGIKSIIEHLKTSDFARLKIGIFQEELAMIPAEKLVLKTFSAEEKAGIKEQILARAGEALDLYLEQGLAAAMNRYN